MSDTTATMLQDKLNSIERNVYDGIDFSQEVTTAYVLADELGERIDQLSAENAKLRDERDRMYKANVEKNGEILRLLEENDKLREQTELLVTLLRNDCDIEASWDGLRRFWSIGLTENGCLMRDRACKAEAENAKLRKLVRDAIYARDDADWASIVSTAIALGVEVDA